MPEFIFTKKTLLEAIEHQEGFAIEPITDDQDKKDCLLVSAQVFSHVMDPKATVMYLMTVTDWSISKKAVYDGKVVGCYLFNKQQITDVINIYDVDHVSENLEKYKNLRGIQGVALALLKEYRDRGFGHQLRDLPLHMGYDYIWGEHMHGLKNKKNWVDFGRRVVAEYKQGFFTIMDLK